MAVSLWKEGPRWNLSNYHSCRIQQAVFCKSLNDFEFVVLKRHFLASTIVPLLNSCCWLVGWQHRKPNTGFPSHVYHGTPKSLACPQSPCVLMPIQRSSVWICMAGRRLSDDDFEFLPGKRASDKDALLVCLSTCLTFFLSFWKGDKS